MCIRDSPFGAQVSILGSLPVGGTVIGIAVYALFPGAAVIGAGDVVGALLLNDRRDIKRTAKMEINGIPFKRPIYKIITAASYIARCV